tara:strand:- start:14 stop:256 length:243 start_codon:yes stop_codon:yes gene_type:complete
LARDRDHATDNWPGISIHQNDVSTLWLILVIDQDPIAVIQRGVHLLATISSDFSNEEPSEEWSDDDPNEQGGDSPLKPRA